VKKEFITGLIAFIAQISGIISILAVIGIFLGSADAGKVLLVAGPVFAVSFLITARIKNGFAWLFGWFLPLPF
jgi:hypothetical protein